MDQMIFSIKLNVINLEFSEFDPTFNIMTLLNVGVYVTTTDSVDRDFGLPHY